MSLRLRPATADPADLDRAVGYATDGPVDPVPALDAERIRAELAAHRMRPEWTWFAEDEDGRILARALWWGRDDSERPLALDCLQVRPEVSDPAALAAELLAAGHEAFGTRPLYNLSLPRDWRAAPAWRKRSAGARRPPGGRA